ncbi:L-cystine-binding protein TcyA, partial [Listeria monocytogenes]|nr:L-cystine-binding protein TcyA [Listeria monocytogenes]
MKKVLLAILSMVLLLSLAACGGSSDSSKDK